MGMILDGGGVQGGVDRQKVFERLDGQAIGEERSPFCFHEEQLRSRRFGEESGQRPEGRRLPALATAMIQPRTGERDRPKQRVERARLLLFALKGGPAVVTLGTGCHKGGDLLCHKLLLQCREELLRFGQR
jgi:hypothetical protein